MVGRLFWAIVVGFLIGVAARSLFQIGLAYAGCLVLIALVMIFFGARERKNRQMGILLATLLVAAALGITRMHGATLSGDPVLTANLGAHVVLEGTIVEEPDIRDSSVRIHIAATHITTSSTSTRIAQGVLAVLPAHADAWYGEQIRAFGILRAPSTFDTGSGRQFAYPEYLGSRGILYELSFAQAEGQQNAATGGNVLQRAAIAVKRSFLDGIASVVPEPEAGLGGGITVGNKRSIGTELSKVFQSVGLVHVVVLSGYNITIVLNAAAWMLLKAPRLAQFGASGIIVAFFVLMTGGAGSATRAGIMALVAILARSTGRVFLAARALGLAAFLIVLWNPFALVFDPSFQLSALATTGLIVFSPLFETRLQKVPKKYALREILCSTLGTQVAVLPLILYQNGTLALYALPANLFALIAMPPAMFFTLIAGIGGMALGHLATPIGFPAYALLGYIIGVAKFFAALPFADASLGAFGIGWVVIAYVTLFSLAWYLHQGGKNKQASLS